MCFFTRAKSLPPYTNACAKDLVVPLSDTRALLKNTSPVSQALSTSNSIPNINHLFRLWYDLSFDITSSFGPRTLPNSCPMRVSVVCCWDCPLTCESRLLKRDFGSFYLLPISSLLVLPHKNGQNYPIIVTAKHGSTYFQKRHLGTALAHWESLEVEEKT